MRVKSVALVTAVLFSGTIIGEVVDCIAATVSTIGKNAAEVILCSEVKGDLDDLINQRLVQAELAKMSQTIKEEDIDSAIRRYYGITNLKLNQNKKDYEESRAKFRALLEKSRIVQFKLKGEAVITDEEIEQAYRLQYGRADIFDVEIEHLLFPVKPGLSLAEIATVKTHATETLNKVSQGHPMKSAAALLKSGEALWTSERIAKKNMQADFADAVFSAKELQVLGPFRSYEGFRIIKVIKRIPVDKTPIEQVRKALHDDLAERKIESLFLKYVEGLRSDSYISKHNHS